MLSQERKERIKHHLFNREQCRPHAEYFAHQAYLMNKDTLFHNELRAKIDAFCMDHFPPCIDEEDLIAGRYCYEWETSEEIAQEAAKLKDAMKVIGTINGMASNATGHRVIDYEKLLAKGMKGVLLEVETLMQNLDFADPECASKRSFYRACQITLEATIRFSKAYQQEAAKLAASASHPARQAELQRMADALAVVPENPATTFFEAMQSMWFVQFVLASVCGDITLTGRPDAYLYPYYKQDQINGIIDEETAMSLIEDLYFKHNMLYGAWPASVMVGGHNRTGEANWNELSYLFIKAIETTGLVNPSVTVCYNKEMPDDLLTLCLEVIEKGYTRPAFFNDDVIIKGLMDAGVTYEDACYYIHSTCVEITPIAASNILVATPYINLNKGLEYILNGGKKIYGDDCQLWNAVDSELKDYDTFEKFYDKVKEVIANILKGMLSGIQDHALYRERYASSPLASCFLNDCLKRGKDSGAGGAKYNFVYPCFPGFINLIDAIVAIKQSVYDEKIVTLEELAQALKDNYEHEERLRAYLINKCPKFGNDIEVVDHIANDLYLFIYEALKQFKISIDGTFHPSYFAWIMHGVQGEQCAATADGRKQAQALSECLGAVQGMDKNGPLALVRSLSKMDQSYGIGGIATNFRLSKSFMKNGLDSVKEFVHEFMRHNNFEMQFNVVDQNTLIDAQKHPEQYRTLLVRVAGYSEYFVNLPPVIQEEVIKRLEHDRL